ncbi:MAG TPA: trypsin-like peptidase domain-containing protein [Fimbriimonas sp.]|nr:trypsin-like peptidase domain-containing protein [Fimbriimonas sp.]
MKTYRPITIYAMLIAAFAGGVATVVSMSNGFSPSKAFAKQTQARAVGNVSEEEMATLHNLNNSMINLAEYVKPAVVHIQVRSERASDEEGRRQPMTMSEGAGFIYRKDGYVITNQHVVGSANEVTVILNDGRELKGTVKKAEEWDVAVIKVNSNDLPTLAMADSKKVQVGQMVMAIGTPFGLENSVTFGHVSAVGRQNAIADTSILGQTSRFYPDLIQTDAAINVGNSGGPLVNIEGQVVGMNSSIYTRTGGSNGIAFAIPSSQVRFIADLLITKGKVVRAQMGIIPRDLKSFEKAELKLTGGAYVEDIAPGTPADKAGIKAGDIIQKVNGIDVVGQIDLRNMMLQHAPGTTISVVYKRGDTTKTVSIKLEEGTKPPAPKVETKPNIDELGDIFGNPDLKQWRDRLRQREDDSKEDVSPLRDDRARLGVSVVQLNAESRSKYNIPSTASGVVVTSVESGSVAEKSGFEVGDLIVAVGGKTISSYVDLTDALSELKVGDTVQIKLSRYEKNSALTITRTIQFK